jgi:hypothetical protein
MTKHKKLQFIREKCIESNPEIVELKFGCLVDTKIWGLGIIRSFTDELEISGKLQPSSWVCSPPLDEDGQTNGDFFIDRETIKKIIGRPIRLSDVLVATDGVARSSSPFPTGSSPIEHQIQRMFRGSWQSFSQGTCRQSGISFPPSVLGA